MSVCFKKLLDEARNCSSSRNGMLMLVDFQPPGFWGEEEKNQLKP